MDAYFIKFSKEELLNQWMAFLIEEIMKEKSIDTTKMSTEEKNTLGTELTQEWCNGKSDIERSDILIEKFGNEEDKLEYKAWKISENL